MKPDASDDELILEKSEHWKWPIAINTPIKIKEGVMLKISSQVTMESLAQIRVESGGTLLLEKANIQTSGNGRLGRIFLEKGGKIYSDTESKIRGVRMK